MTSFLITPRTQIVEPQAGTPSRDGYKFFKELFDKANAVVPTFPEYTVATVPDATVNDNGVIIVSNEAGGRTLATSDGTNWRRVSDGAVVS